MKEYLGVSNKTREVKKTIEGRESELGEESGMDCMRVRMSMTKRECQEVPCPPLQRQAQSHMEYQTRRVPSL